VNENGVGTSHPSVLHATKVWLAAGEPEAEAEPRLPVKAKVMGRAGPSATSSMVTEIRGGVPGRWAATRRRQIIRRSASFALWQSHSKTALETTTDQTAGRDHIHGQRVPTENARFDCDLGYSAESRRARGNARVVLWVQDPLGGRAMRCLVAIVFVTVTLLVAPLAARADLAPTDTIGCVGKKAGDSCTNDSVAGVCKDDTCTSAKPDGTSSSYSCLRCQPGSNDGGCAVGGRASGERFTAQRMGPWLLAGLFSLLFVFRRRRRS
jgi:hypothetical protein